MKLLFAEDEVELSRAVTAILQHHNFIIDAVFNGRDALEYALAGEYDGIILDIMMPGLDGFEVLQKLRQKGVTIPALFLTARGEIDDRIAGLNLGADDYLTKPFDMRELVARVKAMLRRRENFTPENLSFADVTLDTSLCELTSRDGSVRLSNKEFQVMEMLMINRGQLISTDLFMDRLWGYDNEAGTNVVWVYISNLRKKLQSVGSRVNIVTSRGLGYKLEDPL